MSSYSSSTFSFVSYVLVLCMLLGMQISTTSAQLNTNFYATRCPNALSTIQTAVRAAVANERRMGASILRLHFHDCFGCDASVLLDDVTGFTGEKNAGPNANSLRGFNVIDTIKSQLETLCPRTVSCADILTVAARDSVVALGGRSWNVPLGRRDSRIASATAANNNLPGPGSSLSGLITSFGNKGFTPKEMVILSGAHTIGLSRCLHFRNRIHTETNIDMAFANSLKGICPLSGGSNNLAPFDSSTTVFDNTYFRDLTNRRGLLHSDQVLFNGGSTDAQVRIYSNDNPTFLADFAVAMVKMGNLSPLTVLCMLGGMHINTTSAQLSANFYATSCPNVLSTIQTAVRAAVANERRMGASILRLHFHDCFGCDASILLDDTASFTGEKTAGSNANSVRGFDVIDTIKSQVEALCPKTVSCADILAVAARDSVVALGGRSWKVPLGRRDSRTASANDANSNLPGPGSSLSGLITNFANKGFTAKEMVTLSGSHSIGQAQCASFRSRIHTESNIDTAFANSLKGICPTSGSSSNLAPLDSTPILFDNTYYKNLVSKKGLLHSDQELFNGGSTDAHVTAYSNNNPKFLTDFAVAMVKMGNLSPLTGSNGEIRTNCRKTN
ncbi:hypothetical protein MKW92_033556 [Papaver armeniacum]|nr:hypothetical protein MKW92_033556 [Papaver armeniacum]